MTWEIIAGVLRHVLTGAGGVLASRGVIGASDVETAVGSIIFLGGLVWSYVKNRQS